MASEQHDAAPLSAAEIEKVRVVLADGAGLVDGPTQRRLLATIDQYQTALGWSQAAADFRANYLANERESYAQVCHVLSAENVALREVVAAVADDHMHEWEAVDPQEVWACHCGEVSHEWATGVQERARALLDGN